MKRDLKGNYKQFIKLCQSRGITICADPNLLDGSTRVKGKWNGNSHISVQRDGLSQPIVVNGNSTDSKIESFINGAKIANEMAILLHEYGHWFFHHPSRTNTNPYCAYQHEVEAWKYAREVGKQCGLTDFDEFEKEEKISLDSYRNGYKGNNIEVDKISIVKLIYTLSYPLRKYLSKCEHSKS